MVKDGRKHIESLRDGRRIFIDGARVEDPTQHPAFRNAIRSAAGLYEYQAQPANLEKMTFVVADVGRPRQPDVAAADLARRAGRAPAGARSRGRS